jgi:hypothetical protein
MFGSVYGRPFAWLFYPRQSHTGVDRRLRAAWSRGKPIWHQRGKFRIGCRSRGGWHSGRVIRAVLVALVAKYTGDAMHKANISDLHIELM